MAENSGNDQGGAREGVVVVNINEVEHQQQKEATHNPKPMEKQDSLLSFSVPFLQKLMAEILGTVLFDIRRVCIGGCERPTRQSRDAYRSRLGLVMSVLHVPAYVISQVMGSTLAAATLRLLFGLDHDVCSGKHNVFVGTLPSGSDFQSFVIEFIITFYLMFAISGVATDNRAIGELAGLAIGSTVLLNAIIAGPVSGASMNPGRSLGPAIVYNCYKGIWIYIASPILGAVAGACMGL
ncbi:hypothetical protein Bca4012_066202 [Brassica carinata]